MIRAGQGQRSQGGDGGPSELLLAVLDLEATMRRDDLGRVDRVRRIRAEFGFGHTRYGILLSRATDSVPCLMERPLLVHQLWNERDRRRAMRRV